MYGYHYKYKKRTQYTQTHRHTDHRHTDTQTHRHKSVNATIGIMMRRDIKKSGGAQGPSKCVAQGRKESDYAQGPKTVMRKDFRVQRCAET